MHRPQGLCGGTARGGDPFHGDDTRLRRAGRAAWGDGFRLRVTARTPSTQDLAASAARAGAPAGWCDVAEEQSAGRGRLGRRWEAPPGAALLASIVLRPRGRLTWVPIAAGLAVADAVRETCGVAARLKWPNDVLAGPGKLAGILAEVEPRGAPVPAVVLGIGVNVAVDAFPEGVAGASLHALVAPSPPPRREALLASLLTALADRLALVEGGASGLASLRADWEASAAGLGGPVTVRTGSATLEGVAVGLDAEGALRIRRGDGTEVVALGGLVDLS